MVTMLRARPEDILNQNTEKTTNNYVDREIITEIIRYNFILTITVVCSLVICTGVIVYLVTRKQ